MRLRLRIVNIQIPATTINHTRNAAVAISVGTTAIIARSNGSSFSQSAMNHGATITH